MHRILGWNTKRCCLPTCKAEEHGHQEESAHAKSKIKLKNLLDVSFRAFRKDIWKELKIYNFNNMYV